MTSPLAPASPGLGVLPLVGAVLGVGAQVAQPFLAEEQAELQRRAAVKQQAVELAETREQAAAQARQVVRGSWIVGGVLVVGALIYFTLSGGR